MKRRAAPRERNRPGCRAPAFAQIAKPPEEIPVRKPQTPGQEPPKKEGDPFKPAPVPAQPDAELLVCTPYRSVKFTKDTPELGDKSSESRRLSLRRALAIRQLLIDKGIPANRIDVKAMGGIDDHGNADRVDIWLRGAG